MRKIEMMVEQIRENWSPGQVEKLIFNLIYEGVVSFETMVGALKRWGGGNCRGNTAGPDNVPDGEGGPVVIEPGGADAEAFGPEGAADNY